MDYEKELKVNNIADDFVKRLTKLGLSEAEIKDQISLSFLKMKQK